MILKFFMAAAAFTLLATPALAAGAIPDGTYQCMMDGLMNGEMVIAGDTYMGPNYDGQYDGKFEFAVSANNITWNGPIGIYSDPGMEHIGSMVVKEDDGDPAIEIHVKLKDSDNVHVAVCTIEP